MTLIENEADLRAMLYEKWKDTKAQSKLRIIASSALMVCTSRDLLFSKHWCVTKYGGFLRSIKALLYEAWKEVKVFFRRRLKNGMYITFHASQRTELQNNSYITFKSISTKYYKHSSANVTLIF
jgi:hypothetical protein